MIKTTLRIAGMMCGMCEAHVNDAIRARFNVKKVTSSHAKGECVILSDEALDETAPRGNSRHGIRTEVTQFRRI